MKSLWQDGVTMPEFPQQTRNISTEVLVVGGGMAGLLCAYLLAREGADCTLIEAQRVCSGVTAGSSAKITAQHGLIYSRLISSYGIAAAQMYLRANIAALERYAALCERIDCDFERQSSYVYTLSDTKALEDELAALRVLGVRAKFREQLPLPLTVRGALELPEQAQFSPLKFAARIAGRLKIYEHTRLIDVAGSTAITDRGKITARQIIIATHFPIIDRHGGYFLKLHQRRSYMIALAGAQPPSGMYVDAAEHGLSFRRSGELLIIGGGSYRTGAPSSGWRTVCDFAQRHYPSASVKYRWATQDCISLDGVPYIGRYSKATPNLYIAAGFNKWGMSSSMVAAMLLRDRIIGRSSPYARVFSPARSLLHPQLAANVVQSAANMLRLSARRCPHLGCALRWNRYERSWDCPCHGSRFDENGEVINNPATENIE